MRYFRAIIITLLVLAGGISFFIAARNHQASQTLNLPEGTYLVTYSAYLPDPDNTVADFLTELESQMQSYDIQIQTEQRAFNPVSASDPHILHIDFSQRDDRRVIQSFVLVDPLHTVSDILLSDITVYRRPTLPTDINVTTEVITAMTLYAAGEHQAATELLDTLEQPVRAASYADLLDLHTFFRVNLAILAGQYDDALTRLKNQSQLAAYPATLVNQAWLQIQTGQTDDAQHTLNRLDNFYQTNRDMRVHLPHERAELHALLYDYDSALSILDRAIVQGNEQRIIYPELADLYTQRGEVYLLRYEWDAALSDFNRAIEMIPDHADAHFQRGVLHYTMAQRDDALRDFQRYQQLAPDGTHSQQAADYIESIQTEINALQPDRG